MTSFISLIFLLSENFKKTCFKIRDILQPYQQQNDWVKLPRLLFPNRVIQAEENFKNAVLKHYLRFEIYRHED